MDSSVKEEEEELSEKVINSDVLEEEEWPENKEELELAKQEKEDLYAKAVDADASAEEDTDLNAEP